MLNWETPDPRVGRHIATGLLGQYEICGHSQTAQNPRKQLRWVLSAPETIAGVETFRNLDGAKNAAEIIEQTARARLR